MKILQILSAIVILACTHLEGQLTVGVTNYTDEAYDGYVFFSPMRYTDAYLIDNCGKVVNTWQRDARPGLSGYLAPNGMMLRTNKVSGAQFSQASTGGNLELVDWNNNTIWSQDFNTPEYIQHHDAVLLDNGNILFIGWERISPDQQLALGRDPNRISFPNLWGEFIWEITPIGQSDYEVVWEWHLKDHFIQDIDSDKMTFGNVKEEKGKININYQGPGAWDVDDWWHCNALDYNPTLDQIVLNSRNNNELWIIDHSTTTEEAKGSTGGNAGMGGELLFRWGNPEAYDAGSSGNLKMYGSHGHHWIPDGLPNAGKIMYFNNGDGRPEGYYSTVEMIEPEMVGFNYVSDALRRYLPQSPEVVYQDPDDPFRFLSYYLSNAQQLPNGNVFINEGGSGRLFEVNTEGETVWQYISPVRSSGPVEQGSFISGNSIFRAYKYSPDYEGLSNVDLSSEQLLEGPNEFSLCLETSAETVDLDIEYHFDMLNSILFVDLKDRESAKISIYSVSGSLVHSNNISNSFRYDMSSHRKGIYVAYVVDSTRRSVILKFVKR